MKGVVAAALVLFCGTAVAEPIELYGTVGPLPVFLDLSRNGDTVSGWYLYLKRGKQIRLDGKLDHNGFFDLQEYTANTNTRTGSFRGRIKDGHWSGTWRNASGRSPRDISFDVIRDSLKTADGRFQCTAKRVDRQFGYVYRHSLDLSLAGGRVKALSMTRSEKSEDGDSQSCHLALKDMKQISAPVGILLRAKADKLDGQQHCTVRLLRAGDYLLIRPGDPSQSGDDCRGIDGTMFCSPRSFWTDLTLNTKTQMCKSVE